MTTIHTRKPRRSAWATGSSVRDGCRIRLVTIALHPDVLILRLKGTRAEYMLPWSVAYQLAVRAHVDRARADKPKRRRGVNRGGL